MKPQDPTDPQNPQNAGYPQYPSNPQDFSQQGNPPYTPQPQQPRGPEQGWGEQPHDQPARVFVTRPLEPMKQSVSPEMQQRHDESKRRYPYLNLSEGEYIISAVKRHPIGLFSIWFIVGLIGLIMIAVLGAVSMGYFTSENSTTTFPISYVAIPLFLLMVLAILYGLVATSVYNANKFFLTNESVIQHIQTSLFSKREQTVSLGNVEDASYSQNGIVQSMLDYGMLRLSTQGDETTYRFSYASNPKRQIALLNNAVESFKNGRPVTGEA